MRRTLAVALAAMLAPSAAAQTEQSEFERYAIAIGNPCLQGQVTAEAAADTIAKCQKAAADLITLKSAVPGLAGHDLNVFHVVRGSMFTRIASANLPLYGARSQQVCGAVEASWTHFSAFAPASSPSYATMARSLNESAVREVKACRVTFGTPQGGTPVPS